MNKGNKYDVFISYSRRDYVDENKNLLPDNIISKIKDALKKANISYWFDEDGIYCGDAWAEKIAEQIEESSIFLFISSTNSNKAEWTRKEIATAHMLRKKIIPFRLDDSVYHKSVIIYLSDLDFIDYYTNSTLALTRLVDSISKYIKDKKEAAEKLLVKKRQEEDEAKKLANAEQNALIKEVETACSDIDDYEFKSQHARKKATSNVKKLKNADQRARLTTLIQGSGSISSENISLKEEKASLTKENNSLKEEKASLTKENTSLKESINAEKEKTKVLHNCYQSLEEEKNNLATVIAKLRASLLDEERIKADISKSLLKANTEIKENASRHQQEIEGLNSISKKIKKRSIFFTILSILLALFCLIFFIAFLDSYNANSLYYDLYSDYYDKCSEQEEIIESISSGTPLIITDIKIGNTFKDSEIETDYGRDIYESNTMFLNPQITYIGLESKAIELGVKLFKPDGTLSRGDSSPKDFSHSDSYVISKGSDLKKVLIGWGNETKGNWKAGTYKIEIWYNNRCLISKEFTIKAGSPPQKDKRE